MEATRSRAEILLHDYNRYRAHTFHLQRLRAQHPIRDLGLKKGLPIFEALDLWCREQHIDARRWVYHLFRIRKWLHAPGLTTLIPAKKSCASRVAAYREMTDTPFFAATIRQEIENNRLATGAVIDANRDLIPMAENLKRRYLGEGRPEKCLDSIWDGTYGYHPQSLACARCPLTHKCAVDLQSSIAFDIGALRRGEITLQEAHVISARAGHGG